MLNTLINDKPIALNDISLKKLLNKIEHDKKNNIDFEEIDVQKKLKDSVLILKNLLERENANV